mmetsp:Transcript_19633/g.48191  ORF Transcript_19633/g.48191 Transcript_19633/m.48191 type:complete len:273 (-) Transcript_19633:334-1152(-)
MLAAVLVSASALGMTATGASVAPVAPRTVLTPTPKVYVYDHCPFCVRVRLALGIKNVKHNVEFMANDDVDTPTAMVGKKIAPIFVHGDVGPMPESLDIIEYVDSNPAYGPTGVIRPASGRTDFKAWQKKVQTPMRMLQRPRYVKAVGFPEFAQRDGRTAFVKNHQLPPYEKPDWKDDSVISQHQREYLYEQALAQSDKYLPELNEAFKELEAMIHSPECATEGGISIDDIDLWARLRSATLIKGVEIPPKVRAYLDYFAELGDVPLYDTMAI